MLERAGVQNHWRLTADSERRADGAAGAFSRRVARRVLDQDRGHGRVHSADGRFKLGANDDDDTRLANHQALEPPKQPRQPLGVAIAEVGDLLRQTRMHVVEMRHAQALRQQHANRAAFFVRMNGVIPARQRQARGRHGHADVERHFHPRRADADARDERRPETAMNAQTRHIDVAAERVRDEIDGMSQHGQRANPMKF